MSTYSPKPGDINHAWHVIDATDVVLGRLAAQAATLLRGKHKPTYAAHMDTGDFVVIVNAANVVMTSAPTSSSTGTRATRAVCGSGRSARCSRSTRTGSSRRP